MNFLEQSLSELPPHRFEIRIITASEITPLQSHHSIMAPKSKRVLFVDLLMVLFGISTWIGVNFTFNELPVLVQSSPEEWSLPSYITIVVQAANIGPILYGLIKKWMNIPDKILIYFLLTLGTAAAILMAFFYDRRLFNENHSTALLILTFCKALVGCTSSVLFLPYIGRFLDVYLITFIVGEGLSGLLGSVVAMVQGIDKTVCVNKTNEAGEIILQPVTLPGRFSTEVYFLIEFGFMLICFLSFYLLNNLNVAKSQLVQVKSDPLFKPETEEKITLALFRSDYKWLGLFMGSICLFGNGVFPSIQSFSALPYGSKTYHYVVSLSSIANPVACFAAFYLPRSSVKALAALTVICFSCGVYIFTTAVMSPTPFLVGTAVGSILSVFIWVTYTGVLSYLKLSITMIFRNEVAAIIGNSALFWCGAFSQTGSAIGAVVMFLVVNVWEAFESYQQCQS